ncbi:MAG: hypothetical protein ACHQ6U_11715 [Thermodesulfobacteriota bacterium]
MKRILAAALVTLAITFTDVTVFAATIQGFTKQVAAATEIQGKITYIKGHILTIKDETGQKYHLTVSDPKMIEGLKFGDKVMVMEENGKASSIQKIESTTAPKG